MPEVLPLIPSTNLAPSKRAILNPAPTRVAPAQKMTQNQKIVAFKLREVDMMPGDWAETGNPTPYELCTTIQTCKRLWRLNQAALGCWDCDVEVTQQNIRVLEKLYIHLMDYLVE